MAALLVLSKNSQRSSTRTRTYDRLEDRQILMRDIAQARTNGSRLAPACALAGLDPVRCSAADR